MNAKFRSQTSGRLKRPVNLRSAASIEFSRERAVLESMLSVAAQLLLNRLCVLFLVRGDFQHLPRDQLQKTADECSGSNERMCSVVHNEN